MWSSYLSSYINNLIFSLTWLIWSICCFSSISFQFWSRGGNTYQTSILDWISLILSSTFSSQNLFVFFVLMCSRINHTSGLFCDPELTSHFNFFLWIHVFPNWSPISQRGENVCTLKWSPRLWAPIIQFINFLNQWFTIFY